MMFTSDLTGAYYIILIVLVLSGIGLIPPSVAYIIFITLYMLYAGIQMNKDVIKKNHFDNVSLKNTLFESVNFYKYISISFLRDFQ